MVSIGKWSAALCCEWSLCRDVFMSFRKYCREMSQLRSTQLFTRAKTFHRVEYSWLLTATASHHDQFITTRYFVPCCLLKRHTVKLTKLLENRFTSSTDRTTPWKLIRGHAVTPRWLDDAKKCIQSGWSKQRDCPQRMKSRPRMLVASKAAFLENYLAVSTWIFNGSSIEYHEKKH